MLLKLAILSASADLTTYEDGIHPYEIWRLWRRDDNPPGFYYVENCVYTEHRMAAPSTTHVGQYKGPYYPDQLWKFDKVGDYYSIHNFERAGYALCKWGKGSREFGIQTGPADDNKLWKLIPRYEAYLRSLTSAVQFAC